MEFAKNIFGGVQGGLLLLCVLTCMIFAVASGLSVATAFAVSVVVVSGVSGVSGVILIPSHIKHHDPVGCAAALRATNAELGMIIPPSSSIILSGVSAVVSNGELCMAGFGRARSSASR